MKKWFVCVPLILSLFIASCAKAEPDRILLDDAFSYLAVGDHSTVYEAQNNYDRFEKFDMSERNNIARIVGTEGHYVWLRAEFFLPDALKNQDLGFYVSYIHFADEVYLNGHFVGRYGSFPPDERSALFTAHFYHFPRASLKQLEKNTLLVKVWSHGNGHISKNMFVGKYEDAALVADRSSFAHSKSYLLFIGGLFCTMILYFLLYMNRRKEKENLLFALTNLATMFFLMPFCAYEVPWYRATGIPYLVYIEVGLCISLYFLVFFVSLFIVTYLQIKEPRWVFVTHCSIVGLQTLVTVAASDYDFLIRITGFMLFLLVAQIGIAVFYLLREILFSKRNRKHAFVLVLCYSPTLVCMVVDAIVRTFAKVEVNYYFTIVGWHVTILVFLFFLSIRFSLSLRRDEYLTKHLESEVARKTEKLSDQAEVLSQINERLESELNRSNTDLEMASIVQQKFFSYPNVNFRGWDVAICYNPVSKVSGDLFDYYHDGRKLDGFSLFDVSGHGISASLITMLSKGIVFNEFRRAKEKFRLLSEALYRINDQIIEAKGEIENYLTGLLFRFSEFDPNDTCRVEMSNAGHPNPLFYSASDGLVSEIMRDETQEQYGAIGISGVPVCFPNLIFFMNVGDVLVFFTDGLTESMNKKREEFGKERVMSILRESAPKDAQSILEDLIDGLYLFMGGNPREDDLSIIVLKRTASRGYIDYQEDVTELEEVD